MSRVEFSEVTYTEAERLASDGRVAALVPLAAIEQHGPHLPLSTDLLIAEHLAAEIAEKVNDTVLTVPVLPGGLSSHHLGFAGTVNLSEETVRGYVAAYTQALVEMGVMDIFLFSSHGGNFAYLERLAADLNDEFDEARVAAFTNLERYLDVMREAAAASELVVPESDVHAGGLETSQMMFLQGEEKIEVPPGLEGHVASEPGWLEVVLEQGVAGLSANGILGRPEGASADVGGEICAALVGEISAWIEARLADADSAAECGSREETTEGERR